MIPVADFFRIDDLSEALRKCIGKEEDLKEALENTTDRMENVLENIQGEISSCSVKLKDIWGDQFRGHLEDQVRAFQFNYCNKDTAILTRSEYVP